MERDHFIKIFKNAFGNYELPVVFWYSDRPAVEPFLVKGCFFSALKPVREGGIISLGLKTMTCPGAKVYSGFIDLPSFLPDFVSGKERYKSTPELVLDFVKDLSIPDKAEEFINFASIERVKDLDNMEGLIFFATPDVLSGLISWVLFDTNSPDAVSVPFGSGCSSIVSQTIRENQNKGQRTFLGLFDPSVRPQVEPDILSLAIPMSRFKEISHTFNDSCLQGTHAWKKVKDRIKNCN